MKKKLLFLFTALALVIWSVNAQEPVAPLQYDMTFKGRGEATTVQSVTVENLSTGESLTLSGDKVLRLTNTLSDTTDVGIEVVSIPKVTSLIYPNPSYGQATLVFANRAEGNVNISIFDVMGRTLNSGTFYLETGKHTAVLPDMPTGNYVVSIQGKGIRDAIKWVSTGSSFGGTISFTGYESDVDPNNYPSLPEPKPQFSAKSSNGIVEMLYADGELLRFTGKNGNMTTIVMNIPTLSHDIAFDFYTCKDANNKYYAIVNVGGMLWMAEDLRNVPTTEVALRTSAADWSDYPADQPKQAYFEFNASNASKGSFYNYAGAKKALPQDWNLPTAGEVDYMLSKLGGYARAGNLLKARGDAWAQQQTVPDTVSFDALALGELTPTGAFSGKDFRIKYWTRSTKNSVPVFWGIENSTAILGKDVTASIGHGLRVRGCRPAPSAYADVADMFGTSSGAPQKATMRSIFADGPLGGMYNIFLDKQNLWSSFNAPTEANPVMKYYDYNSAALVPLPAKSAYNNRLQKAAAVNNTSGTQNLAVALWSRGTGLTGNIIEGEGTVSIVFYKDSTGGYAKGDSIKLSANYNMPPYTGNSFINKYSGNFGSGANGQFITFNSPGAWINEDKATQIYNYFMQSIGINSGITGLGYWYTASVPGLLDYHRWYSARMQLLSADFNKDGTGDLVVMVGNRIDVYNGVAPHNIIYTKTFTNNNIRMAVGDVDGDNNPDIAVIYPLNTENARVEVFLGGNLNETTSTFITVPYGDWNDIKIGNIKYGGKNSIITMTRKASEVTANIRIIDYNANELGNLAAITTANTEVNTGSTVYGTTNDNITLCRFRGSTYPADIVAQGQVCRYNDNNALTKYSLTYMLWQMAPNGNGQIGITILPDNIVAGNFNNDPSGKETLSFYRSFAQVNNNYSVGTVTGGNSFTINGAYIEYSESQQWTGITANTGATTFTVTYPVAQLTTQNLSNTSTFRLNYAATGTVAANGSYDYLYANSITVTGVTNSTYSYQLLGTARSTEPGKGLKYVEHQTSMSEPRIYALLAAPPYYAFKPNGDPYEYGNFASMGTSWGKSEVTGSSTSNESSQKSSVIFGFEQEFNAPIIGTKLGSIEFTAKLEQEWTTEESQNTVTTQSIEFTAPQNDAVILTASFFDTYTYEVVSSGNPDEIGSLLSISLPTQNHTLGMKLEDYNRLAADNPECPNLKQIFKHKVGFPFTYPSDKSQIQSNAGGSVLWAAPFGGNEFVTVGSGVDVNRSISVDTETSQSAGFSFGMEMELVATMMGVKVGAGFGCNETNTSTHTEGSGHSIAGNVSGLNSLGEAGLSHFRWTIGWYKYRLGGQEFPVVQYVVKP